MAFFALILSIDADFFPQKINPLRKLRKCAQTKTHCLQQQQRLNENWNDFSFTLNFIVLFPFQKDHLNCMYLWHASYWIVLNRIQFHAEFLTNTLAKFSVVALYPIVLGSGKFHGMFIQVFRNNWNFWRHPMNFSSSHSTISKIPQNLKLMVENIRNTYRHT